MLRGTSTSNNYWLSIPLLLSLPQYLLKSMDSSIAEGYKGSEGKRDYCSLIHPAHMVFSNLKILKTSIKFEFIFNENKFIMYYITNEDVYEKNRN